MKKKIKDAMVGFDNQGDSCIYIRIIDEEGEFTGEYVGGDELEEIVSFLNSQEGYVDEQHLSGEPEPGE